MIDRLDQLNGGGSASSRGDLAIDDLAEEARGAHQIARADARFLHALAAGNPQRALAAHDQFCERLIRRYRCGPGSNDLAQSRLKATGDSTTKRCSLR